MTGLDDDLQGMSRDRLIAEVRRLRQGIREHRDASGHDLCWHHPQLWGLLPERIDPAVAIPPWPKFLRGCLKYREALERELPSAPCWIGSMTDRDQARSRRGPADQR